MPSGFGSSGYAAGWYWAVFSSDTAGVLYSDTYVSGRVTRDFSPTAFPVNLTGWLNQTAAEITGPTGFTLEGGAMGKNGVIKSHIRTLGNNSGTKTYRVYLGSAVIGMMTPTTYPNMEVILSSRNQGIETLQNNSRTTGVGQAGATVTAAEYTAVDTTVPQNIAISLESSALLCTILLHADFTVTYGE